MSEEEVSLISSVPMGRGRGRGGGVPVLPAGVFSSLGDEKDDKKPHSGQYDDIRNDDHLVQESMAYKKHDDNREEDHLGRRNPSFDHSNTDAKDDGNHHASSNNGTKPLRQRKDFSQEFPYATHSNPAKKSYGDKNQKAGVDWTCNCGNLNWHWRLQCHTCQNPKPANLVTGNEVRDGAGSGFFERQDRASMTTGIEVDMDGFDDFGRRKTSTTTKSNHHRNYEEETSPTAAAAAVDTHKTDVPETKEQAALRRLQEKYQLLLPDQNNNITHTTGNNAAYATNNKTSGTTGSIKTAATNDKDTKSSGSSHRRRDRSRSRSNDHRRNKSNHADNHSSSSSNYNRDNHRNDPRDSNYGRDSNYRRDGNSNSNRDKSYRSDSRDRHHSSNNASRDRPYRR